MAEKMAAKMVVKMDGLSVLLSDLLSVEQWVDSMDALMADCLVNLKVALWVDWLEFQMDLKSVGLMEW